MKKMIVLLSMSVLLFTGFAQPISAMTSDTPREKTTSQEKPIRENFKMTVETEEYLEYTYEENGESYKVEEHISEDEIGKYVSSVIYKKKNNDFVVDSTHEMSLSNATGVMNIDIIKDGKVNTETLQLNSTNSTSQGIIQPNDHHPDWTFVGTFHYSDRIINLTVAVISILIGKRIKLGPVPVLTQIAAAAYAVFAETLYYTVKEWGIHHPGTIIPAGKEEHSWVYTDRYRQNLVPNAGHWPKAYIRNYPK